MTVTNILLVVLILAAAALLFVSVTLLARTQANADKIDAYFKSYGEMVSANQKAMFDQQDIRLRELNDNFSRLRHENSVQIDNIRQTVDEKLQTTLENRLTKSFGLVNDRLEQVYKGLGEMQTIASNVGDLKKILSNVKTRGILGEVQLGAILEQILHREQYEENVATNPGSRNRVEFAVKLPGDGTETVYLPIDAKFPADTYHALLNAYEAGDKALIAERRKKLGNTIVSEAKDISEKYIAPPHTTDFAVMFLPFEGLYAEVVRDGLIEVLQRRYKVTIAGPTTMAALLNSLQMGFNTLAIEKRSSEVWKLLGAIRTEFDTFGTVLTQTQERLNKANADLDKLVGVRTRQIQRKLRNVTALDAPDAARLIDEETE